MDITILGLRKYDLIVIKIKPFLRIIGDTIASSDKVDQLQPKILNLGNVGLSEIYKPK